MLGFNVAGNCVMPIERLSRSAERSDDGADEKHCGRHHPAAQRSAAFLASYVHKEHRTQQTLEKTVTANHIYSARVRSDMWSRRLRIRGNETTSIVVSGPETYTGHSR